MTSPTAVDFKVLWEWITGNLFSSFRCPDALVLQNSNPDRAALIFWILLRDSIILFFLFQYVIVNNSSFKYHPRYILNKDYNNFPPPTNTQARKKKRKEMQIEKEEGRGREKNRGEKERVWEERKERKRESKDQESLGNKYLKLFLFLVFSPGRCGITVIGVLNGALPWGLPELGNQNKGPEQ